MKTRIEIYILKAQILRTNIRIRVLDIKLWLLKLASRIVDKALELQSEKEKLNDSRMD